MALERAPAHIRGAQGGAARMSDPDMIEGIINAVTISGDGKSPIGHSVEAQILQALGVDYIDESEALHPGGLEHHINKHKFTIPFVCGARTGRGAPSYQRRRGHDSGTKVSRHR